MRYLLMIHGEESYYEGLSDGENAALMKDYQEFGEALQSAGVHQASDRLTPTSAATTVRVREGQMLTTDGPFAETKEQLGGFYMIDVKDLDEALQWAARIPCAKTGCVEVRPVWE